MNTKYPIEALFFPIIENPVIVNNLIVNEYFAVCKKQFESFLGIKRKNQKYLSNNQAFQKALDVYNDLTQAIPKPITWWQNDKCNLASIVINGITADELFFNKSRDFDFVNSKNNFLKELANNYDNKFIETTLKDLNVAIGIVNGYDIDHPSNYYLMLQWNKDSNNVKYLAISRISTSESLKKIVNKFRDDFDEFIETTWHRYNTPIEKQNIKAVLYNMYDKNIESTTLQNDETKLANIKTFEEKVNKFLDRNNTLNYFAFTEFIIQNTHLFSDENFNVRDSNNIITQSNVYQSSIARFKNLYNNPKNRSDFEFSNYHKLDSVRHIIR